MLEKICLMLMLLIPAMAHAEVTSVGPGKISFPFVVKPTKHAESAQDGRSFSTNFNHFFEVSNGSGAGKIIEIRTSYYYSNKVDSATMQAWARDDLAKKAADAGTKLVEPVKISGVEFNLIDGILDDKKKSPVLMLSGVINGAWIRIYLIKPEQVDLNVQLLAAIKTYEIDFAALLKFKADFDNKALNLAKNNKLVTPVGLLSEPTGLDARLASYSVSYDAQGIPASARASFSMFKMGFWSAQALVFSSACSMGLIDESWDEAKLLDTSKDEDDDWEYTKVTPVVAVKLGNLDTKHFSAIQKGKNGYSNYNYGRWVAIDAKNRYLFSVLRDNGMSVEKQILTSMAAQPLACDLATFVANLNAKPDPVAPKK